MNVLAYYFHKSCIFYLMYLYNRLQREIFLGWGCKRDRSVAITRLQARYAGALWSRRVMAT